MTIQEHLKQLVDYCWADEMNNFAETFTAHIQSQDTLEPWIALCEQDNGRSAKMRKHIFYTLMKIKLEFNL